MDLKQELIEVMRKARQGREPGTPRLEAIADSVVDWINKRDTPAAPMTDNLRDAAQAVLDRWDSLDWKAAPTADYMNRLRAALAAATQPEALRFPDSLTPAQRTIHDALCDSQWLAGLKAGWNAGSIQDPDRAQAAYDQLRASRDGYLAGYHEARAALAAAPQPAPEREALVEVIAEARGRFTPNEMAWAGDGYHDEERAIADAILARGLRLPGETEPGLREAAQLGLEMAEINSLHHTAEKIREALKRRETRGWGVVVEGEVVWVDMDADQRIAETVADEEGGKASRVAIRVVEGGDDE